MASLEKGSVGNKGMAINDIGYKLGEIVSELRGLSKNIAENDEQIKKMSDEIRYLRDKISVNDGIKKGVLWFFSCGSSLGILQALSKLFEVFK